MWSREIERNGKREEGRESDSESLSRKISSSWGFLLVLLRPGLLGYGGPWVILLEIPLLHSPCPGYPQGIDVIPIIWDSMWVHVDLWGELTTESRRWHTESRRWQKPVTTLDRQLSALGSHTSNVHRTVELRVWGALMHLCGTMRSSPKQVNTEVKEYV